MRAGTYKMAVAAFLCKNHDVEHTTVQIAEACTITNHQAGIAAGSLAREHPNVVRTRVGARGSRAQPALYKWDSTKGATE